MNKKRKVAIIIIGISLLFFTLIFLYYKFIKNFNFENISDSTITALLIGLAIVLVAFSKPKDTLDRQWRHKGWWDK